MSWTDDLRCLHCGGRLPLYRKITHGQFCSSAHRKSYDEQQQQLGYERLLETQSLLQKQIPLLDHAQPAEIATEPRSSSILLEDRLAVQEFQPEAPVFVAPPARVVEPQRPAGIAPPVAEFVTSPNAKPAARALGRIAAAVKVLEPLQHSQTLQVAIPAAPLEPWVPEPLQHTGPTLTPACIRSVAPAAEIVRIDIDPFPVPLAVALPENHFRTESRVATAAAKAGRKKSKHKEPAEAPLAVQLTRAVAIPLRAVGAEYGLEPKIASVYPVRRNARPTLPNSPLNAESDPPIATQVGLPAGSPVRSAKSGGAASDGQLIFRVHLATPQMAPVEFESGIRQGSLLPIPQGTPPVSRPKPTAAKLDGFDPHLLVTLPQLDAAPLVEERDPPFGGLVRLPVRFGAPIAPPPAHGKQILSVPLPCRVDALRPRRVLELAGGLEQINRLAAPFVARESGPAFAPPTLLARIAARREWKALLFAVPVLLAMSFYPSLQKASANTGSSGFMKQVRQSLSQRAAIALDEDFREGLDFWTGKSGEAADWSYDATGFVQPGDLALYSPSMTLSDYQLQFLGMIDKKALSWVVRAKDFDNYYVLKLAVTKPGPLPDVAITRYAVVNGRAVDRVDTKVHLDARADTIYRVSMNVRGDDFTLFIQGQMIDTWSDRRLDQGGIGFFTARGEESRVRWVQVTHQYDMIGRLCAYLAPYPIPNTGSFEQ